ncbi:MAG: LysR family transcriptional regulator [Paracoccaceae bacterium]
MAKTIDWAELPYFLAVARSGSLRSAADQVGGTHATVDRHLRALELAYGVRLFERSTAGLALTPAGEELLPMAENAEAAVISAPRRVQGLDREAAGRVHVSVSPSLVFNVLPPVFARFFDLYPEIDLEITVTNRFQDLARSEADVSIRVAHEVNDDVVGRRVLQYAKGIYASHEYLDKYWAWRGPNGEGLHWIGWGDASDMPNWVRDSPFARAAIRHRVPEGFLVMQLVRQGQGMSYLPCYAEKHCPELVRVPGTEVTLDRSIWLLLHADLRKTTRVRLFVDFMASELRAMKKMFLGEAG